jgi:hypothetical protein
MARQKDDPDRRGMGAESDAISEQFVPSELYKAQQRVMAETLVAAGLSPVQISKMLSVPLDLPSEEDAATRDIEPNEDLKPGT